MKLLEIVKDNIHRLNIKTDTDRRVALYRLLLPGLKNNISLKSLILSIIDEIEVNEQKLDSSILYALKHIYKNGIDQGKTFADSMSGWIPDMERTIIDSAESTGKLVMGIKRAEENAIRSAKLFSLVLAAIFEPSVILIMGFIIFYFCGFIIFPEFKALVTEIPPLSQPFAHFVGFIERHGYATVISMVSVIVMIIVSMENYIGKGRNTLDILPPWVFMRLSVSANFLASLSTLIAEKVAYKSAMQMIHGSSGKYLKWHVGRMLERFEKDANEGKSLTSTNFFSPLIALQIGILTKEGETSSALENISVELFEYTERSITYVSKIIKFSLIAFVLLMVLWAIGSIGNILYVFYQQTRGAL